MGGELGRETVRERKRNREENKSVSLNKEGEDKTKEKGENLDSVSE